MALRKTNNKNVKLSIVKLRRGCHYDGYIFKRKNLNWAAQNPPLGHWLDIAELHLYHNLNEYNIMSFSELLNMIRKSVEHITE